MWPQTRSTQRVPQLGRVVVAHALDQLEAGAGDQLGRALGRRSGRSACRRRRASPASGRRTSRSASARDPTRRRRSIWRPTPAGSKQRSNGRAGVGRASGPRRRTPGCPTRASAGDVPLDVPTRGRSPAARSARRSASGVASAVLGLAGARHHRRHRQQPVAVVDGQLLHDHPAHRQPHHVGPFARRPRRARRSRRRPCRRAVARAPARRPALGRGGSTGRRRGCRSGSPASPGRRTARTTRWRS